MTVVIQGLQHPALSEGSRLCWALLSLVHERFGYRAPAPDRIQGDAVIPHSSYTAQSRITSSQSLPTQPQPIHRPTPPDFWWSIGAGLWIGIPPPRSPRRCVAASTLLTHQSPYKDDGGGCGRGRSARIDNNPQPDHHPAHDHDFVHSRLVEKSSPPGDWRSTRAIIVSLKPDPKTPPRGRGFLLSRLRL